jgi:hypothetical protein
LSLAEDLDGVAHEKEPSFTSATAEFLVTNHAGSERL